MLTWLPLRWRFKSCGLADDSFLMCTVELLEAGEPAREASDSTWSIEWDCHPLLTLTIAYERRVLSSAESFNKDGVSNGNMTRPVGKIQPKTHLSKSAGGSGSHTDGACVPCVTSRARGRWAGSFVCGLDHSVGHALPRQSIPILRYPFLGGSNLGKLQQL